MSATDAGAAQQRAAGSSQVVQNVIADPQALSNSCLRPSKSPSGRLPSAVKTKSPSTGCAAMISCAAALNGITMSLPDL